jgi:hypothetical protein
VSEDEFYFIEVSSESEYETLSIGNVDVAVELCEYGN